MLRTVAAGLAVCALACAPSPSHGQTAADAAKEAVTPATKALEHRDVLIAQCPPAAARLPETEAAKHPIHVTAWGSAGPSVLIVHGGVQGGLGGGPSTFAKQEALAQQGWRLQLVDRPGFGQSGSRGVDDMQADAVWIADMLGGGAHLIGHSWGGAETLLAAARRPEAVRSLVLVEPAMQSLMIGDPAVERDPVLKADTLRWAGLLMSAQTPRDYALGFAHSLGAVETGGNASDTAVAALDADPQLAARYGCALLQARMATPSAMVQAAQAIARAHVPVLVITGGWSPFFDAVGEKAAALTGGRHVVVRSANHFVQLSGAAAFNKAVDAFMRDADKIRSPQ